ncbi:DUF6660 family protein [Niastella vici]|uniref:DUF6660 family protein n=1 Tax=Niastella vici TaxID=1703345 RepID=UPI00117CD119|nr:DUF6660 family protein [Niastella vici]
MKFFAFIMAVIVLMQSWMPCADDAAVSTGAKANTIISKSPAQQKDKNHNDNCSPFCQCACCAGFSINHSFASVSALEVICSQHFTSYLPINIIEIALPVWQPPQLAA